MDADVDRIAELFDAIRAGDVDAVTALLDHDPEIVNRRLEGGPQPVMAAAYLGRRELARLLVARGAELDVFAAAALGEVEQMAALLAWRPGLLGARAPDGWTPLHLAAHFGHVRAVKLLLARGADVYARSANGMANQALHAALAGRHRAVAEILLAHGADVNARQAGGFTALHAAAQHGDADLTGLLLAHGADPTAMTDDRRTALTIARDAGRDGLIGLLQRRGAAA